MHYGLAPEALCVHIFPRYGDFPQTGVARKNHRGGASTDASASMLTQNKKLSQAPLGIETRVSLIIDETKACQNAGAPNQHSRPIRL